MEHNSFRGTLWVAFGMEQYLRRMWELFTDKKSMGESSLVGCGKREAGRNTRQLAKGVAIQAGSGIGQAQKWLEFFLVCQCVEHTTQAGQGIGWERYEEGFQKDGRLSVWASTEVKECYDKVESEDIGRLSIAEDILCKSTDF